MKRREIGGGYRTSDLCLVPGTRIASVRSSDMVPESPSKAGLLGFSVAFSSAVSPDRVQTPFRQGGVRGLSGQPHACLWGRGLHFLLLDCRGSRRATLLILVSLMGLSTWLEGPFTSDPGLRVLIQLPVGYKFRSGPSPTTVSYL